MIFGLKIFITWLKNLRKKESTLKILKNQFIFKRPNVSKHRGKSEISLGQRYNNIGANV